MGRLFPPELPIYGGCLCGAVRFSITAAPLLVYACHCTDCQRRSGSAFCLSMLVKTESFMVTCGTSKFWRQIGAGGIENTHRFCGNCGGGIASEKNSRPDTTTVRAGTLDNTSWMRPIAHVHLRHAQAWQRIPNNTVCFEIMPSDLESLSSKWQDLWQSVKWVTA
jgi:hypothetical protein